MTPEQFTYWLQGFAELNPDTPPNATQWKQIQDHLNLVFKKVTPTIQPYPFGPGISPGPINPINPMNPAPYNPGTWTSPTFPGTRPEVICSVSPTTSSQFSAYATSTLPDYNVGEIVLKTDSKERIRL